MAQATLFLLVTAIFTAAQTTTPPVAAPQAVPIKLAVIDTDAFGDPKTGVKRLLDAYNKIEIAIKPKRDELTTLQNRYSALAKEVQDLQKAPNPNTRLIEQKVDEGQTLENDIKRKQEDGQKALERLTRDMTGPINADLANAVQAYAKQRGYDIVLDASKFAGTMILINQALDITDAFIADYNAKNPVAAAPTKP
jgi:Skp family chaperone for outer membrane proteins